MTQPAAQPPPGLARLHRLVRFGGVVRCVELEIDYAQRNPVTAHREGRVQVQAQRPRRPPGAADRFEALAARVGREVQVGPVLDQKRQGLALHPPQRALAMAGQDGGRRHRRAVRVLDHPVVPLHRRLAARRGREEGFRRRPAWISALRTRRCVSRASPSGAEPNSFSAQLALSRSSPGARMRFADITMSSRRWRSDVCPAQHQSVARPETTAPAFRRHKGLGQNRTDAIDRLKVRDNPPRRDRGRAAGQCGARNTGRDNGMTGPSLRDLQSGEHAVGAEWITTELIFPRKEQSEAACNHNIREPGTAGSP